MQRVQLVRSEMNFFSRVQPLSGAFCALVDNRLQSSHTCRAPDRIRMSIPTLPALRHNCSMEERKAFLIGECDRAEESLKRGSHRATTSGGHVVVVTFARLFQADGDIFALVGSTLSSYYSNKYCAKSSSTDKA